MILGPLAILIAWAVMGYVYRLTKEEDLATLSERALVDRRTRGLFTGAMVISAILIYFYLTGWVGPRLDLPNSFDVLVALAASLQILTAIFPYRDGWANWHDGAIFGEALLLVPISAMIAARLGLIAEILVVVMVVFLVTMAAYTFALPRRRSFIWLQAGYALSCHIVLLLVTLR